MKDSELEEQLLGVIEPIEMKKEVVDWIVLKLSEGAGEEALEIETRLARLRSDSARLGTKIEQVYDDKLEGKLTEEFCLKKMKDLEEKKVRVEEAIRNLDKAGPSDYLGRLRKVLEPTISLKKQYISLPEHKRGTILRNVCLNLKQMGKRIVPTYQKPYDILVRGNASGNWLPVVGSIRTWAGAGIVVDSPLFAMAASRGPT